MMGLECLIDVYSMYANQDDSIGGPEITGSIVFEGVHGRVEAVPTTMMALYQGLTTGQAYYATLVPDNLDIRNNYIFVVRWPTDHVLINKPLRVLQTTHTSGRMPVAHIECLLERWDEDLQPSLG